MNSGIASAGLTSQKSIPSSPSRLTFLEAIPRLNNTDISYYLTWRHYNCSSLAKEDRSGELRRINLEPKDFCIKWVKTHKPQDWGYYKACVRELASVTGLSPRTIESWGPDFGKRPDSVLVTLHKEDIIRTNNIASASEIQMLEPLEPAEFCSKWVPIKKGIEPQEYGYRKACCELLSEITGYNETTCNNWITTTPERIPRLVRMYLRAMDALWQMQKLMSSTLNNVNK